MLGNFLTVWRIKHTELHTVTIHFYKNSSIILCLSQKALSLPCRGEHDDAGSEY